MNTARRSHTATTLTDGRILVAGGRGSLPGNSSEVFDISADVWINTVTILADGEVMIAGGFGFNTLRTVETYTFTDGGWSSGESAAKFRQDFRACAKSRVCIV
jgi:hypothetical protein